MTIGDIIVFEAGDNIYADARIIEANGLKLLESTLTGESVSVDKSEKNIFNKSYKLFLKIIKTIFNLLFKCIYHLLYYDIKYFIYQY